MFRRLVKKALPSLAIQNLQALRRWTKEASYSRLDRRQVFEKIYQTGAWGTSSDRPYSSGSGSDDNLTSPYVEAVRATFEQINPKKVVDLGCGDFRVGRKLLDARWSYVGVDIVSELIEHHRRTERFAGLSFECRDICNDELPSGDVVLIRQVLQHLSNSDIHSILPRLRAFDWLLVSEHVPTGEFQPNLDKPTGPSTRSVKRSGVVLHAAPFGLPEGELVCSIPLAQAGFEGDQLVTHLYDLRSTQLP